MRWVVVLVGMFLLALAPAAMATTLPDSATERFERRMIEDRSLPMWDGQIPMVAFGPSCKQKVEPDGDIFDLRLKRGIQLVYASPVTVSGWRSPGGTCERFNARIKLHGSRFKWRSWEKIQNSLQRVKFQQYFSYVWEYDDRNFLQRFEPGLLIFGQLDELPHLRLLVDMDLADYFQVRLEHTLNLASLAHTAWRANLDYTF